MADFIRIFSPSDASWPPFPSGYENWSYSGVGQFRESLMRGRIWEEQYPPIFSEDVNLRKFMTYINMLWNTKTIFTIQHKHIGEPVGTISGSPTVNGASQTGSSIICTAITGTLKQGDVIKIAGLNIVFDVAADVGNGATSIPISPMIPVGNSPAHGAAITYTGIKFRAVLHENLVLPRCNIDRYYVGLTLKFRECP